MKKKKGFYNAIKDDMIILINVGTNNNMYYNIVWLTNEDLGVGIRSF